MSMPRPSSQASSTYSNNRPSFQKKLKPRIHGLTGFDQNLNQSVILDTVNTEPNPGTSFYSSRSERLIQESKLSEEMNKTVSQLSKLNFTQHCSETCLCNECNCGRHLCKLNNIKPDLTKTTIYKKDFEKKRWTPNKVVIAKQYNKLEGPHLDMKSTQRHSFTNRQGDKIQRPIPEDLIKSTPPVQLLTTYKSLFPGHRGPNQYIKPTNIHIRQKFPLRSKSTYTSNFVEKDKKKDNYKYMDGMLKTGGNWYGTTSYGKFFENPNPQYHAKKVKNVEKREENLGFNHQYGTFKSYLETVYKNDFVSKEGTVCSAKIILETRGKGQYIDSKGSFAENSDFKAMSPEYHAFSTSGFKFV